MSDGEGEYGNNEECTIRALRSLVVTATEFHTEQGHDFLTIKGTQFHGSEDAPQSVPLAQGAEMQWSSDGSVTAPGFMLCASEAGWFAMTLSLVTKAGDPSSRHRFTHECVNDVLVSVH